MSVYAFLKDWVLIVGFEHPAKEIVSVLKNSPSAEYLSKHTKIQFRTSKAE